MRMWISLALAAAMFAAGVLMWLSHDHAAPRRSSGGGGEPDPSYPKARPKPQSTP